MPVPFVDLRSHYRRGVAARAGVPGRDVTSLTTKIRYRGFSLPSRNEVWKRASKEVRVARAQSRVIGTCVPA